MNKELYDMIGAAEPPRAKLSEQEENQIFERVLGQPAKKRRRKLLPMLVKSAAALAACLLLMVGVNAANPVFAEQIPILGNIFAWFNHDAVESKRHLISDRLPEVAAPIEQAAEVPEECPYTFTLNEAYCDGLYLRFTSTISAPDDSLASYDWLSSEGTIGEDWDFNILNLDTGEKSYPRIAAPWEKVDDKTFVSELIFDLSEWGELPETLRIRFNSGSIATYHPNDKVDTKENYEANKFSVNAQGYRVDFEVKVDESLNRSAPSQTVNGVELTRVTAAVGETRVEYKLPADNYEGVLPIVKTAGGLKLQPFGGRTAFPENGYAGYCDFDAVPEDCDTLDITLFNKNTDEILAEFTVTLE